MRPLNQGGMQNVPHCEKNRCVQTPAPDAYQVPLHFAQKASDTQAVFLTHPAGQWGEIGDVFCGGQPEGPPANTGVARRTEVAAVAAKTIIRMGDLPLKHGNWPCTASFVTHTSKMSR
jgi:hypothetical protein